MICNKCNEDKEPDLFPKPYKGQTKKTCNRCLSKNWKFNILSTLSSNEMRRRKKFDRYAPDYQPFYEGITTKFLNELKEKQEGKCYWLGVEMDFTHENNLRKPALDRIDKSKPFTPENSVLACMFANLGRAMNDSSTEQMYELLASIDVQKLNQSSSTLSI